MRAVKILLVAFFITAIVTGYIIYNSGMSVSISVKTPGRNDAGEQGGPAAVSGTEGATVPADDTAPGENPALHAVRRVHQIFQSLEVEDEKGFNEILGLLPQIDWSVYTQEYGTTGDNGLGAVELLEWLTDNPMTMQGDNMISIFQATKGLDGVIAEQYSVIVGDFFRSDVERYVKLLSRVDRQNIDRVCYHTAYNNYYHVDPGEAKESVSAFFEGKDLSGNERYVVDTVVEAIGAYITEEST